MKLQLRFEKNIERVELNGSENETLKSLIDAAENCFRLQTGTFFVSLNRKDELRGSDNAPLSSFDIVSGDRIFVIERDKRKREKEKPGKSKAMSQREPTPTKTCKPSNSESEHASTSGTATAGLSNDKQQPERPVKAEEQFECISLEPMVIRDSTDDKIPLRLRTLLEKEMPQNEQEVLILICHILLLETGFNIKVKGDTGNDDPTLLDTRNKGSYSLTYSHDYCEQSTVTIVFVPMSSMLVAHAKLTGTSGAVSPLQLQFTDYIGNVVQGYPSTWKHLSSLSQIFKDNFALPILAAMRQNLNLPVLYGFLALMPEIQLKILSFLNVRDLMSLSSVCKHLHSLSNDSALWRRLAIKDFSLRKNKDTNWKRVYIQNYHYKLEMERRRRMKLHQDYPVQVVPPSFGLVPQYPQPFPNAFPGIRGGDYDLDPFSQSPTSLFNPRGIGSLPNSGPLPGARFDPLNPFRDPSNRPGRGGGLRDNYHNRLNFGGGFF
ncbi:F-box only protein 7-like [Antedon mediterranea]|uniref:F-box only protein 7-like n=1 Tax=Antedon mediterranea TaxID=105859 RepID=UPI003AF7A2BA